MERFPFRATAGAVEALATPVKPEATCVSSSDAVTTTDWRDGVPALGGALVTLRELRADDAPALCAMLTTEEVSRFITPPPTTVAGFEQFIAWTHAERKSGRFFCYGVVPAGMTTAIGIIQVRALDTGFSIAEWGFVIGAPFWGTGMFPEAARLVVDFACDTVGVHRLEARAAIANGRGNGALRKIGAVQEGVLRQAFLRNGQYHDQVLWSILAGDWRRQWMDRAPRVH
jgi:RimJ/RimL family protein N-acetyltransferase